ncbi:MAG: ATP-binding protein [Clostridiales bacterium]|nr:ATP-binding protein [Clostridiales bacterium]
MANDIDIRNYTELTKSLALAEHTVYKRYLTELDKYPVISPSESLKDEAADNCLRFFKLEELTCKKGEDIFQKLATVYHSSMLLGCNLAVIVDAPTNNSPIGIYIGVRNQGYSSTDKLNLRTSFNTLKNGINSNFPGTKTENISAKNTIDEIFGDHVKNISSVSCVASIRDKSKTENKSFIQGIERFIDTMKGNSYTAVFIAEPISVNELAEVRGGYESLYSTLSSFGKSIWSYNENESKAVMESLSEGISNSVSEGTNSTQAHTNSSGWSMELNFSGSTNSGTSSSTTSPTGVSRLGSALGGMSGNSQGLINAINIIGKAVSVAVPVVGGAMMAAGAIGGALRGVSTASGITNSIGKNLGMFGAVNKGKADTDSEGKTKIDTKSKTRTETKGTTDTTGTGKTLQIENTNKPIQEMLKRIEEQLKRTQEGEDYGAYSCGAYFLAAKQETSLLAANTYRALMIGEGSSVESGAINTWNYINYKGKDEAEEEKANTNNAKISAIKEYLKRFVHPIFAMPLTDNIKTGENFIAYTAGTVVSGMELPLHLGLPTRSVYGLPVIEHAEFGRNVTDKGLKAAEDSREINLGKVYHMGQVETGSNVDLNIEGLASHTFITGSTGSGKSNAVYHILNEADKQGVKFLVVEPAKGEYKDVFGGRNDVSVYGTNNKKTDLLRINPFSFPEDVHVLEHIDRLIEIFNVCWPMYAAMPAVLKDAVERAYIKAGWDLNQSECKYISDEGVKLYPGFVDVLQQINVVMEESKYSSDSKGDYTGALCTRVKSLTNGLYSQIFTANELSDEELYDENVIIDLSRVGSTETKSLIMGLLVMKMQEYRMSARTNSNSQLKHLTVLEEAHNLLKHTSTEQSSETSNLLGKSVEMLANSIAEMRTYGEGFIIADQSPGLLDMSVIRNTNTKIILRLPDLSDRELVGKAAALNDDQITELSKLETGVAAVYQNNWLEPVLCKVKEFKNENGEGFKYSPRISDKDYDNKQKAKLVKYILQPAYEKFGFDKNEIKKLENSVYKMQLTAETKANIFRFIKEESIDKIKNLRSKIIYGVINSETALGLSNAERKNMGLWYDLMLEALEPDISQLEKTERDKILGIIVNEFNEAKKNNLSSELYNEFFKYIKK